MKEGLPRLALRVLCVVVFGHKEPAEAELVRSKLRELPDDFKMKPVRAYISCARCGSMMEMRV